MILGALGALGFYPLLGPSSTPSSTPSPAPSPSPSPSSKLYYARGSSYDSWWKEPITEYDDSYAAPAASYDYDYDYDYDYATPLYYWDGNEEPLSASRSSPPAFLEGVSPPPSPPPLSGGAWGSQAEELAPNN